MCSRLPLVTCILVCLLIAPSGCAFLAGDATDEWDIVIAISGTFENDHALIFLNDELIFADSLHAFSPASTDVGWQSGPWIEQAITDSGQRLRVSINGETAGTFTFNAYTRRFVSCVYDHTTRLMHFTSYEKPVPIEG